jgi:hypothetical protein
MTAATYDEQVTARARKALEVTLARGANSMWGAHAIMALAPDDEKIVEIVRKGLEVDAVRPGENLKGGPFHILPTALLLRRWEDQLPAEAMSIIKEFMLHGIHERGNTENHWLMYYTGELLGAELWEDEPIWWNGLSPRAMQEEAKRWILGMIERTALHGHHEFDSPGYHMEHMAPLIGLVCHTRDESFRHQVNQMLSLLVADMALEFFHGSWAGGHSREGYRQNTWSRVGPIQPLQYIYFGGLEFDPLLHCQGFAVPALASSYRPPALFADIAWGRDTAHVVKKTKAPRTIFRHVDRPAQPVRKYTYMSLSFALGTTQVGLPGAPAGPIDLVSWDLTWKGPKHQAKITCNHPYSHPGRFSAFLSDYPQSIGRSVGTGKPYLQYPDRLFGASPHERLMQHEGTAIALYRIPPEDETPFINIFLPKGIAWNERDGWLLGDAGDFYIALRPIGPYHWNSITEANASSIMVSEGDLIDGWLLRVEGNDIGLILEAAEADNFATFCQQRLAADLDLSGWPRDRRVSVSTINGEKLEMTYDGEHKIDDQPIDYASYPLYEAPGVEAPLNTGKMKFQHGEEKLDLDFGIDPQKPLLPMRVIG